MVIYVEHQIGNVLIFDRFKLLTHRELQTVRAKFIFDLNS